MILQKYTPKWVGWCIVPTFDRRPLYESILVRFLWMLKFNSPKNLVLKPITIMPFFVSYLQKRKIDIVHQRILKKRNYFLWTQSQMWNTMYRMIWTLFSEWSTKPLLLKFHRKWQFWWKNVHSYTWHENFNRFKNIFL